MFSKRYRIKSKYYEDGTERHMVQWKVFLFWHDYEIDSYYGDCAVFSKKEQALQWLADRLKTNNCIREEIEEVNV